MRTLKAFGLSVSALLIPFFSFSAEAMSAKDQIIAYDDCNYGNLLITLNLDNRSSKKDLLNGMKAILDYPVFTVTPLATDSLEVKFQVSAPMCDEEMEQQGQGKQNQGQHRKSSKKRYSHDPEQSQTCRTPEGWNEMQWRLLLIKGVEIRCDDPEQSEDEAQEDPGGGVVIST